jgi:hypothetical protein
MGCTGNTIDSAYYTVVARVNGPQIPTSFCVSPDTVKIGPNGSRQLTAIVKDQFGTLFSPAIVWRVSGGGSIDSTGLFTSSGETGTFLVTDSLRDFPAFKATAVIIVENVLFKYSRDFSSTQGLNQTYYQFLDNGVYKNMTWNSSGSVPYWNGNDNGTYPALLGGGFHPGPNTDAALKWVAPFSCKIKVSGTVKKSDLNGGDGVVATVKHGNTVIWGPDTIASSDGIGHQHNDTLTVTAGDAIYFILNRKGDYTFDGTSWDPAIIQLDDQNVATGGADAALNLPLSTSPNPFNPEVTLRFSLDNKSAITLQVFDIRGNLVRHLMQGEQTAGPHAVVWNGRDNNGHLLSSGIYIIRLISNGREEVKRVLFVK